MAGVPTWVRETPGLMSGWWIGSGDAARYSLGVAMATSSKDGVKRLVALALLSVLGAAIV